MPPKSARHAQTVYDAAKFGMLGVFVVVLAISGLMAVAITRGLLRQLGGEPAVAAEMARAVAGGDLSTTLPVKPGDTSSLMAALRDMQNSLAQVVANVRLGSQGVATASAEIAHGNNDLSQRTELQAAALQQTSASMGQLDETVRHNADNARQASELANSASTMAARGGEAVAEVVSTMKGINDSSRQISDITGVIDGIAFQTNILALNAAVEAARAGEQGRGFAVVATEVRMLAQRSAEAARQIKQLIAASVERVEQGSAQVNHAGDRMNEVVSSIQHVAQIRGRDHRRRRPAARRRAAGRHRRQPARPDHAAERGPGGRKRRRGRRPEAAGRATGAGGGGVPAARLMPAPQRGTRGLDGLPTIGS